MKSLSNGSILMTVLGEAWTRDRAKTNISFRFNEATYSMFLWCQDSPGGHVTWVECELPKTSDSRRLVTFADDEVLALLRAHRQPWNQMRGTDLPDVAEATYFGDGS